MKEIFILGLGKEVKNQNMELFMKKTLGCYMKDIGKITKKMEKEHLNFQINNFISETF